MSKKKGFSNVGFILATLGSAVGLGNLWLFPTALISHGGIAFLVPYLLALFTLGLPFFILETTLGNKWRRSPVIAFKNYWKNAGPAFGCLQAIGQFILGTFYAYVVAWVLLMFLSSFSGDFGNSFSYFDDKILNYQPVPKGESVSYSNMWKWGSSFWTFITLIGIFILTWIIVNRGIKKGIELACKIMIPILFILLIIFFVYSFTIKGFQRGVEAVFKPDFSKLSKFKAWGSAFGKAIFSLSLVSAIIMIYSANAPKDKDNTTQAFIIISGDTLIALLGGFIVAATIGGMMTTGLEIDGEHYGMGTVDKGVEEGKIFAKGFNVSEKQGIVSEDWKSFAIFKKDGTVFDKNIGGTTLIFKTFPVFFKGIGEQTGFKYFGNLLSAFFFLSAFFAGLSSLIGEVETGAYTLKENTGMKRKYGTLITILIQFFFGIFFVWNANKGAMYTITSNTLIVWMLLLLSFQQAFLFATKPKAVFDLIEFNNKNSKIKWNKKFFYSLVITSLISITFVICSSLVDTIMNVPAGWAEVSSFQWILLSVCFFIPIIFWTVGIVWYKKKTKFEPAPLEE